METCWPDIISQKKADTKKSVLMLGQLQIQLTGIEPAIDCHAGPALTWYWMGRLTLCVPSRPTSYRRLH